MRAASPAVSLCLKSWQNVVKVTTFLGFLYPFLDLSFLRSVEQVLTDRKAMNPLVEGWLGSQLMKELV